MSDSRATSEQPTPQVGQIWVARNKNILGRVVQVLAVNDSRVRIVNVKSRQGSDSAVSSFVRNYRPAPEDAP